MGRTSAIRVFVTGTGTDVGKTYVTCELLREAMRRGVRVCALKPVATGVADGSPRDADLHAAAQGVARRPEVYAFQAPLSPHLAARLEGRSIEIAPIASAAAELGGEHDLVLIEGAGGLFSPLGRELDNGALARALDVSVVVVVVADRLGALHDLASTLIAARASNVPPLLVVFNAPAQADASTGTNADEARVLGLCEPVATFTRARSATSGATASPAARLLDAILEGFEGSDLRQSADASGGGSP